MEIPNSCSFPSNHSGSVNTLKFNFNGMKLATGGNDAKINIFSTDKLFTDSPLPETTLISHNKPINSLSFSHPCYGTYLASCGKDKKLIIWKEKSKNNYENIFEYKHNSEITSCKFSPYEYGIIILCGTKDGTISIHELQKNTQIFINKIIKNDENCCINSVDWAPALPPMNLDDSDDDENIENDKILEKMKFIICDNNKNLKIYEANDGTIESFYLKTEIKLDAIAKDVAFLNFSGYTELTFAVGLDNGECLIYKFIGENWEKRGIIKVNGSINKVCWSLCGTYLGISYYNGIVSFYRENMDETWVEVK